MEEEIYDPAVHGPIIKPEEAYDPATHGQISKNTPFVDKVTSAAGRALNPIGSALGAGVDYLQEHGPDIPYVDLPNPWSYNPGKSVAGGLMNAPKEILTTGLAANEMLDEWSDPYGLSVGGLPDNAAAVVDQTLPEYHTDGLADAIVTEGTQAAVGGGAGMAVMKNSIKNLPRIFRYGAKLLGAEGGASVAIDQDTTGLLVGEQRPDDILPKLWGGVAIDPNGNYNEELLKKRLNIFADAWLVAKTGEKIAKTGVGAVKFINSIVGTPIDEWIRKSPKEQAIVREMSDTLQGWHDNMDPEAQYQWRQKLIKDVEEYSKLQAETGVEGIDDIDIRRDTMTAIERSIPDTKEGRAYAAKVRSLRTGQKGKGSSQLEAASSQAAHATKDLNQQTFDVFGGDEGIEAAREGIQETGFRQVDPYKDEVVRADQKLTEADEDLTNLVENDESMTQRLPGYEDKVKLDVGKTKRVVADEVVDAIDDESMIRTKRKNDLYAAIPEDAHANTALLNDSIEKADRALDDNLRAKLGQAGDNFKKLDEFAHFELTDAISSAWKEGNKNKAKALEALKRSITEDQLDYLVVSGDQQTSDAAKAAKKYYVEEFAPYFRQGPGKELQKLGVTKKQLNPDDYREKSRQILKQNLDNPEAAEHTSRIYKLLESRGDEKLLVDYAMGDVAADAQRVINAKGKLDPDDIVTLSSKLEKFGPLLEKSGEGKRIEDFLTKLRNKKFSKQELQENLNNVTKIAQEAEDQILGEQLKDFFSKSGTGYKANEDGYTIFKKIMDDPQRTKELSGLIKAAGSSDNPLAKEGMKSAYAKWVSDRFFKAGDDAAGAPLINEKTYKDDLKKMNEIGEQIFGKDSPLLLAQQKVMEEAGKISLSETQRAFRLHDVGATDKGMRDSASTIITFLFGTLDRTGARIRAASGRAITTLSKADQAKEIMDIMYANPDEFVRVLKEVAKKDRVNLSKETKDKLYAMVSKGLVFADHNSVETKRPNNLDKASRKSFEQTQRVLGEQ